MSWVAHKRYLIWVLTEYTAICEATCETLQLIRVDIQILHHWPRRISSVGRGSFKGLSLVQVLCLFSSIENPFVKVSFSRSGISDNLIQWTSLSIATSHAHTHTHTSSFPPFACSNLLGSLARLMVFFSLSRTRLLSSFLSFSSMKLELAIMALFLSKTVQSVLVLDSKLLS